MSKPRQNHLSTKAGHPRRAQMRAYVRDITHLIMEFKIFDKAKPVEICK